MTNPSPPAKAGSAYDQGVAAGRDNKGILTNPYTADTTDFRRWVDGWVEGIKLWRADRLAEFKEPT